jgi:hypothetical protein
VPLRASMLQATGAGDAGRSHAARDHRGVAGHAAARGEDAFGGVHAVNVLGAGLDPHQNDLAARLGGLHGFSDVNTISPVAAPATPEVPSL